MSDDRELHVGSGGLWIPPELREFDSQIVFRTPRSTIQHFESNPLEGYYGMIDESDFGDVEDPANPGLEPNQISIKPQGEDAMVFDVETDPDVRCDGGGSETTPREQRKRNKDVYEAVVRAVDYNSGRKQPPLAKQSSVIQTLHGAGYGRYGLEELHKAITAARRNGDLFRAKDERGDVRLGINEAEALVEKIESNLEHANSVNGDVIGLANARVQELRGDGDE